MAEPVPAARTRKMFRVAIMLAAAVGVASAKTDRTSPAAHTPSRLPGAHAPEGHAGTWRAVPAESFVGYRVRERLGFLPAPSDAVGRTSSVTGTVRIEGDKIISTSVSTDLRTLKSDKSNRDGCVKQHLGRYPRAGFRLTSAIALPNVSVEQPFSLSAHARFTMHGVTRAVVVPLQARWSSDRFQVIARMRIRFSDYRIKSLRIGPVVSVSDFATMEVQLSFARV
jgi:polyisoprenoid-binding protein YceI